VNALDFDLNVCTLYVCVYVCVCARACVCGDGGGGGDTMRGVQNTRDTHVCVCKRCAHTHLNVADDAKHSSATRSLITIFDRFRCGEHRFDKRHLDLLHPLSFLFSIVWHVRRGHGKKVNLINLDSDGPFQEILP
jgi:hypothetical protein